MIEACFPRFSTRQQGREESGDTTSSDRFSICLSADAMLRRSVAAAKPAIGSSLFQTFD
jgi:hypothetical protein